MSEENVKTKTALGEQNQISLVVQVTHHTHPMCYIIAAAYNRFLFHSIFSFSLRQSAVAVIVDIVIDDLV